MNLTINTKNNVYSKTHMNKFYTCYSTSIKTRKLFWGTHEKKSVQFHFRPQRKRKTLKTRQTKFSRSQHDFLFGITLRRMIWNENTNKFVSLTLYNCYYQIYSSCKLNILTVPGHPWSANLSTYALPTLQNYLTISVAKTLGKYFQNM